MDNRKNDDKNLNNGGNNFFNKNPILIFAIFAIVIVVAFRGLGGGDMDGTLLGQSAAGSKGTSYSELKEAIANAKAVLDKHRDDKKQAGYASRHLGNLDKSRG